MEYLSKETTFRLKEKKKILRGARDYDLFTQNKSTPIFSIKEKTNIFKKTLSLSSAFNAMLGIKLMVIDSDGITQFIIKKGFAPATTAAFKLKNKRGDMLNKASNPIRFNDDSFIEIKSFDNQIIFKSGITKRRMWFPIHIFQSEKANTDLSSGKISGVPHVTITRNEHSIRASGNEYLLIFSEPPESNLDLITIVNFAIAADYQFDYKRSSSGYD